MSKAFLAHVIEAAGDISAVDANHIAKELMNAIIKEIRINGRFTLWGFGTFKVARTNARKGMNPRTREPIAVKEGKTVRFKASSTLKVSI